MKNKTSPKRKGIVAAWLASSLLVKAISLLIAIIIGILIIVTAYGLIKWLGYKIHLMQEHREQQMTNASASVEIRVYPPNVTDHTLAGDTTNAIQPSFSGQPIPPQVWTVQYGISSLNGPWIYSGTNQFFTTSSTPPELVVNTPTQEVFQYNVGGEWYLETAEWDADGNFLDDYVTENAAPMDTTGLSTVVIDSSPDLFNWTPINTNGVCPADSAQIYNDTNASPVANFYRVRVITDP